MFCTSQQMLNQTTLQILDPPIDYGLLLSFLYRMGLVIIAVASFGFTYIYFSEITYYN